MTAVQQETVKLLFETTRLMIPVVTGFLAVYLGALGAFWKAGHTPILLARRWLITSPVVLGVTSLGIWSGALPFSIRAMYHQDVTLFKYGQYCAQAGHVLFFLAVTASAICILGLLRGQEGVSRDAK